MKFHNRQAAGEQLTVQLLQYKEQPHTIVIGVPRGGVVVAAAIARALKLPLDIIVTRKIGAPDYEELAIGAITEDGSVMLNQPLVDAYSISEQYISEQVRRQVVEAQRRLRLYRGKRAPLDLHHTTVLLVDDGLATGYTMLAAIASAKAKGAKKIIVVVPVAPPDTIETIRQQVDDVVVLSTPHWFGALGGFYEEFDQVEDDEVKQFLSLHT
jgi:predicted phosphoribosyltransferase